MLELNSISFIPYSKLLQVIHIPISTQYIGIN